MTSLSALLYLIIWPIVTRALFTRNMGTLENLLYGGFCLYFIILTFCAVFARIIQSDEPPDEPRPLFIRAFCPVSRARRRLIGLTIFTASSAIMLVLNLYGQLSDFRFSLIAPCMFAGIGGLLGIHLCPPIESEKKTTIQKQSLQKIPHKKEPLPKEPAPKCPATPPQDLPQSAPTHISNNISLWEIPFTINMLDNTNKLQTVLPVPVRNKELKRVINIRNTVGPYEFEEIEYKWLQMALIEGNSHELKHIATTMIFTAKRHIPELSVKDLVGCASSLVSGIIECRPINEKKVVSWEHLCLPLEVLKTRKACLLELMALYGVLIHHLVVGSEIHLFIPPLDQMTGNWALTVRGPFERDYLSFRFKDFALVPEPHEESIKRPVGWEICLDKHGSVKGKVVEG